MNIMLDEGAYMPVKAYEHDAGYDLRSPYELTVWDDESITINTGVHVEIPAGYVGLLKSKSGLNVKHGLTGEGVIDSGYTGSIVVKLYNNSDYPYKINKGDKIIQLIVLPILNEELVLVDKFKTTDRGTRGFGSTGR